MPQTNRRQRRNNRKRRTTKVTKRSRLPALGMPSKQLVRLKYVDEITLDPSAGGIATSVFSANGMWDPYIGAGGHQPLYFDQYMANYDHYSVLGSKIKVTPLPNDSQYATTSTPGAYGVIVDDDVTFSYTSLAQIVESNQSRGKWRMYSNKLTGANTSGKRPTIVQHFSAKKMIADPLGDSNKGTVASNPSDGVFYQVWTSSVNANDPVPCSFLVELEYIALLTEPKFIAQS